MTDLPDNALAHAAWPLLAHQHGSALRAAVAYVVQSFQPLAIVAAGSIVRGEPDRASDLDICVIHRAPYKQRLQRWFAGVPVEIFVNPPGAIREYFASEHQSGRPCTAHMLATGFPVLSCDVLETLRREAHEWLAKRSPLSQQQDTAGRYAAAGLLEDAEDIGERDPANCSALLSEAVLAMLHHYLRLRNGVLPARKRLLAEVARADVALSRQVRAFFATADLKLRIELARSIAATCVGAQGFFEWESERLPAPL
ncbi:MAG TPA: nucleotidyltransferase domain-containing protein [Polyangiaceae bacterium]|nr:nucleotidyltransferase domain-containing protein [Polyangiaceae bacterium]